MSYDVVESQTFWDCVMSMRRDDGYHAALMETLIELRRQPFRNPTLQTHDVGSVKNGKKIFSSDVGGRKSDRRLIRRSPMTCHISPASLLLPDGSTTDAG